MKRRQFLLVFALVCLVVSVLASCVSSTPTPNSYGTYNTPEPNLYSNTANGITVEVIGGGFVKMVDRINGVVCYDRGTTFCLDRPNAR